MVNDGQKAEAAVFNAAFVSKTTLTTKGDLVGRTTAGPQRVPVGANGDVLVADSAQATGVAYSGRLTSAEGDISTLQGDVSTLQGDVSTLQTDVTTLQGDVSTLQSDLSTAQGDITALQTGKANTTLNNIGSTAVNADILPDGDNTRSLGSGSLNWASIRGVFFGIPGSGTGRFGTPIATGASNSGVSNYRSGSVVDGTSGVANFGSGAASGTGSSGDVNVGAGTVVSGVRGILNLLGRFVTFPSLAANPSSPVAGGVYYNSASNVLRFYNGSAWSDVGAGGGFTAATQAEMEAATSTTVGVTPGRTQYHPGVAKAWVQWVSSTVLASYNVSSVTDNGSADQTINFTTAFSSASYSMAGMSGLNNTSMRAVCQPYNFSGPAAGSCRLQIIQSDGLLSAAVRGQAVFYGDQ